MDATTLSANFDARERATSELRSLVDQFAGKDMDADARSKEANLLESVADFDGRIRRGIESLKANESVSSLLDGIELGDKRAKGDDVAAQLRGLEFGEKVEFRGEHGELSRRDLNIGAAPAGTNPRTFHGKLLAEAIERSTVMRGGAQIMTTSGGEPIDFTVVTGRASAGIIAEKGSIPESNPTTKVRSVGAFKYGYSSVLSHEFVADEKVDLVGFLVRDAGPAIGHGMGAHFLTGTGTGQPRGLFTAASAAAATWAEGAKDNTVSDALIDLFYELPTAYRGNAAYVVSDATAAIMRKLKDGNGQYLYQPALTVGAPDTFNGRAVLSDAGVPDDKVAFADLSKYTVRLAGGLRVERSVDAKFDTDQIVYRFIQRADGLLLDELSAKVLTVTGA
ncbi:phage major capsid protein [Streptomyces sp. NPDC050421]|uniref:phage major capsid protein n=1 Tax=Streptomyces sp. NPDC050421 TaxID=3365613 RepID=UPI0037A836FD